MSTRSEGAKRRWSMPGVREEQGEKVKAYFDTEGARERHGLKMSAVYNDAEKRAERRKRGLSQWEANRERMLEAQKKGRERKKMLAATAT